MKVAFYKSKQRLFNRLVCWYLKGSYSHCELVLKDNSDGTSLCLSSSFMDGGVRLKNIYLDKNKWDFIELNDPRFTLEHALDYYEQHKNTKYDVLGLLGFIWRRQTGIKHKMFCSEVLADYIGYEEPFRFDPVILYQSLNVVKVFNNNLA